MHLVDTLFAVERVDGRLIRRRFTDYHGNKPSLYSCVCLPWIFQTWRKRRKSPIIDPPFPMLVMDAIRFLQSVVKPGWRVLELGGGNSTLWFLKRGVQLTTLESSVEWARFIGRKADHPDLRVVSPAEAAAFVDGVPDGQFDLVLVDCKAAVMNRNDAVRAVRSKVRNGGWLMMDNTDAPRFRAAIEIMKDRPRLVFSGFTPMRFVVCQTSAWHM
jgi:predicted O-methyltransferase YrrM